MYRRKIMNRKKKKEKKKVGPRGFRFLFPKTPTTRATSLMMSWSFSSSMKWVAPSNKPSWKKARFLFLTRDIKKKRNHPCFSLMQSYTIFNKKMQCNVFLPHVLLTRRQIFYLSQCLYWWFNFCKKKSTHYCDLLFILSN